MAWFYLIIAGMAEVAWSTCMKLSDGFSNLPYSVATIVGMLISFGTLVAATKHFPISLAYPIWTGIGAVGAVVVGLVFFHDRVGVTTLVFAALLIISIIGIKISSGN